MIDCYQNLQRAKDHLWLFQIDRELLCSSKQTSEQSSAISCEHLTPSLEVRLHAESYKIAHYATKHLQEIIKENNHLLNNHVILDISNNDEINGRWKVAVLDENKGFFAKILDFFPFTRGLEEKNILDITVTREDTGVFSSIKNLFFSKVFIPDSNYKVIDSPFSITPKSFKFDIDLSPQELLQQEPFADGFTKIAAEALQHWEEHFISRIDAKNSYRIVLRDKYLELDKMSSDTSFPLEREENRVTLRTYKDFLIREFGIEYIQYIEYQYGINLNHMIEEGLPLHPEHVYRFNIGVNNVEMQGIEQLFQKIKHMCTVLHGDALNDKPFSELTHFTSNLGIDPRKPCLREVRALYHLIVKELFPGASINEINLQHSDVREFIKQFIEPIMPSSIADLRPDLFNKLVHLLMTPDAYYDNIYTGKKVTHKAIMGYYIFENSRFFQPWIDMHGLLQIYPQCKKQDDWENYYELLSHVVAKKHLVRRHPADIWRVGALVPAPNAKDGSPRWYKVESCVDDGNGDFNYTLSKACKTYEGMPAIKLYRSTASAPYAMGGWRSISADFQLSRAPGTANRDLADEYEMPFFQKRTIPIWVAYYLKAQKLRESPILELLPLQEQHALWTQILYDYRKGIDLMEKTLGLRKVKKGIQNEYISQASLEKIKQIALHYERVLERKGNELKELPQYKISEDITFVGHSLGGALAQGGIFHFGPEARRIPLPERKFTCYASDAPAVTTDDVNQFYQFGMEHRSVLNFFKQKWKLILQLEYGDPIPQAGEQHLSATTLPPSKYESWLEISNRIFKPLDTAIIKEMTTIPTHGRRTGRGIEGRDFSYHYLTPKELASFNSAWWLTLEEQRIFGYRLINSPRLTEWLRRFIAFIKIPLTKVSESVSEYLFPPRGSEITDQDGCFYVPYHFNNRKIVNLVTK